MDKRKICFCVTVAGTYKAFLLDLSHYLIEKHNYDVTVICDADESMYEFTNENLHYIPIKMKRGLSIEGMGVIFRLYKIFKREKFDIVQYSTRNAGTYASIAAWMAGIKCRLYCQWGMMYIALKGFLRFLLWLDEKIITGISTVIESESFSMYETAINRGVYKSDKASVIWNGSACGVNIEKYDLSKREEWRKQIRDKYDIPDDAIVFGWCGRITRDKGHNELFEAFKKLNEINKNARLLMVGSYDNVNTIDKDLFAWAQSCPEVIFAGFSKEVPKMYSAMDVFCSLSYREGFGLVVIEAAAMQLPGIVSDALGQRDTIEDQETGILVRTKNVDDVVKAMVTCIEQPEKVKAMGVKARKCVEEKYDQKELFKQLAEHRNNQIVGK